MAFLRTFAGLMMAVLLVGCVAGKEEKSCVVEESGTDVGIMCKQNLDSVQDTNGTELSWAEVLEAASAASVVEIHLSNFTLDSKVMAVMHTAMERLGGDKNVTLVLESPTAYRVSNLAIDAHVFPENVFYDVIIRDGNFTENQVVHLSAEGVRSDMFPVALSIMSSVVHRNQVVLASVGYSVGDLANVVALMDVDFKDNQVVVAAGRVIGGDLGIGVGGVNVTATRNQVIGAGGALIGGDLKTVAEVDVTGQDNSLMFKFLAHNNSAAAPVLAEFVHGVVTNDPLTLGMLPRLIEAVCQEMEQHGQGAGDHEHEGRTTVLHQLIDLLGGMLCPKPTPASPELPRPDDDDDDNDDDDDDDVPPSPEAPGTFNRAFDLEKFLDDLPDEINKDPVWGPLVSVIRANIQSALLLEDIGDALFQRLHDGESLDAIVADLPENVATSPVVVAFVEAIRANPWLGEMLYEVSKESK